jgi:Mg-chelatase subunit ChlD
MKIHLLSSIVLPFICIAQLVLAATIEVRSVYSDPVGGVSMVIRVPDGAALETTDLRLLEDETLSVSAKKINSLQVSDWKVFLVLCIDTSGSMKKDPLEETKSALIAVLNNKLFGAKDRIALISFDDKPRLKHFFAQPAKIIEKVLELESKGDKTLLYEALFESLDHLEKLPPAPPELRHILLVSDGKDEGSQKSLTEVREKAIELGIAIDVVARVRKDRIEEDLREGFVQNLNALAVETGGRFQHAKPGDVYEAISQVLQEVMATSVVYFERKINTAGSMTKSVGIELKLPDGSTVSDSIPMQIPSTIQTFWKVWGLALFSIGILVLIFILLVFLFGHKKSKAGEKPALYKEPSSGVAPKPRREVPRRTQVGGYNFPVPAKGNPTAILIGLSGPFDGQQFPVEKESFYIGAGDECDLSIPEDDYVSARHAYLHFERGSLFVFDQNSQNGTFVNEEPVTDKGVALTLGDRVRFGVSAFEIAKSPQ